MTCRSGRVLWRLKQCNDIDHEQQQLRHLKLPFTKPGLPRSTSVVSRSNSGSTSTRQDREAQELQTELSTLRNHRAAAAYALKTTQPAPPDAAEAERLRQSRERDKQFLRSEIITKRRQALEWIEHLESISDHHQARLEREMLLDLPKMVCQEYHLNAGLLTEVLAELETAA